MRNAIPLPWRIVAGVVIVVVACTPIAMSQTEISTGVIAYVGQTPSGIYLVSDDAPPKRLTPRTPDDQGGPLAWSADGRRIAFADDGLAVVDVVDGKVQRVTDQADTSPSWDNLGRLWFRRGGELYRMRLGDAATHVETECGDGPGEISADGKRFVYRAGDEIRVCSTSSAGGDQLVVKMGDGADALGPRWSPNGQRVVYFTPPGAGDRGVFVVGADGSNNDHVGTGAWPDWSLDGKSLVATDLDQPSGLFVMNANGSGRRTVEGAVGTAPSWGRRFRQPSSGDPPSDEGQTNDDGDTAATDATDDGEPARRHVGTVEAERRPSGDAEEAPEEATDAKKKRPAGRPKASPGSFAAPESEDGPSPGWLIAGILGGLAMMGAGSGIGFWLLRRGGA